MASFIFRTITVVCAIVMIAASMAAADEPSLQHAAAYTGSQAVVGWLMSEKLDGIRGYWTGSELRTRKGHPIHAPKWFTQSLPPFALDGELWRKRNDVAFVQKTVLDDVPSENWEEITYNIFEVPDAPGDFPSRLEKARAWFAAHPAPHIRILEQVVCEGPDHLDAFLETIESMGGEGVVIKNPSLPFHSGRSSQMLKVKRFSDMEGAVVGHHPGNGKLAGMMGSLTLRLENGVTFRLGTGFSLAERQNPPPIGAVVTFKYQGFTENGIPRFASFMRVRKD